MSAIKTVTIPLFMVACGTYISFPGKRKKYLVKDHCQTYIKIRHGLSSDYEDGRNFDAVQGTHLRTSSGKTLVVDSSRFVCEIN